MPYDIGGTASNGVDYVALPGFVTIPPGERRALITIVPIDDGPPDVNKTVDSRAGAFHQHAAGLSPRLPATCGGHHH